MGWLWRFGNGTSGSQDTANSSTSTPTPTPAAEPDRSLSRDEQAEAEFQAFITRLRAQQEAHDNEQPSPPPPTEQHLKKTPPTEQRQQFKQTPPDPESIHPYALVPKTMSCRTSFDYAFFCQSFGGQWVNIYRYGTLRDCSERWREFWFCMRTMSYPAEEKEAKIADFHREKISERFNPGNDGERKPNSEDVWEMRRTPVRGAFEGDLVALEEMMKAREMRDAGARESAT